MDSYEGQIMGLPIDRLSSRLPRRFPVGARYVVEGYGGEKGNLRLIARYVVLPGGRRINIPAANLSPAGIACRPTAQRPILSDPRMILRDWGLRGDCADCCEMCGFNLVTPRLSAAPRAAAPAAWRSSRPRVGASSLVSRFGVPGKLAFRIP